MFRAFNLFHVLLRCFSYVAVAFLVFVFFTNGHADGNSWYYMMVWGTVASVVIDIWIHRKKRINIINGKLQVQTGNKIVKEIILGDTRIIKGMNGVVLKSSAFEETLHYKDFDKNSVLILKRL